MVKHHTITIRPYRVQCSCGYQADTPTGSAAQRLAHIHARVEKHATIFDHRLCSERCKVASRHPAVTYFNWHDPDCFNYRPPILLPEIGHTKCLCGEEFDILCVHICDCGRQYLVPVSPSEV